MVHPECASEQQIQETRTVFSLNNPFYVGTSSSLTALRIIDPATVRFTFDSRPEIGVWAAGSVWVDTNGNFVFDPENTDFTNRDISCLTHSTQFS